VRPGGAWSRSGFPTTRGRRARRPAPDHPSSGGPSRTSGCSAFGSGPTAPARCGGGSRSPAGGGLSLSGLDRPPGPRQGS
jgi:hypothetical protein